MQGVPRPAQRNVLTHTLFTMDQILSCGVRLSSLRDVIGAKKSCMLMINPAAFQRFSDAERRGGTLEEGDLRSEFDQ